MRERGFTLLEMLVATLVMGVAVVALLGNISTSLNNASRLVDHDRAALLARQKMDEILLDQRARGVLEDRFDPALAGGIEAGWRAEISPFETPPQVRPGAFILERVHLEIWWMSGGRRRTFPLDGYRRTRVMGEPQ